MDTCTKCGAELGVGRFCLNCGHPIGAPVPDATVRTPRVPRERHEAAAEQARRLQGAGTAPAAGPSIEREDGWFLSGRPGDEEPDRLNWGAWVLAALALVAAALLALSYLDGRSSTRATDDPGDAAPSPAAAERSEEPQDQAVGEQEEDPPATPAVDVARGATVAVPTTAPPTTDLDGALVPYDAARMVDGDPATAWRMPGDGTGAQITLTLPEPAEIRRVGLVNGYAKRVAGVDWYPNNRRVLAVRWTFEDGSSVDQTLAEVPRVQWLKVVPGTTSTVTLTLLSVSPPGVGTLGRDYTAISSVVLSGRPAG